MRSRVQGSVDTYEVVSQCSRLVPRVSMEQMPRRVASSRITSHLHPSSPFLTPRTDSASLLPHRTPPPPPPSTLPHHPSTTVVQRTVARPDRLRPNAQHRQQATATRSEEKRVTAHSLRTRTRTRMRQARTTRTRTRKGRRTRRSRQRRRRGGRVGDSELGDDSGALTSPFGGHARSSAAQGREEERGEHNVETRLISARA